MKIEFTEVENSFSRYEVWAEGRELQWYKKAWSTLEKGGLTTYDNELDRSLVLIRMFTIIMIYHEFCDLAFGQRFYYELGDWEEEFSMFRLGQLSIKELDEDDLIYNLEEDEATNQAFRKLVEKERNKVIKCLFDNIDNILGRETTVFMAMYLTCFTPNNEEDEKLKINDEKMSDYEYFEKLIEKYSDDILNHLDFDEEEAYGWLSEGTYKIR